MNKKKGPQETSVVNTKTGNKKVKDQSTPQTLYCF